MKKIVLFTVAALTCNIILAQSFDECTGAVDINSVFGGPVGVEQVIGPYDNTGATTGTQDPILGWECFGEPDGTGSNPELNNTVWFTFTGDGNNYLVESGTCAGVTNYIDDGDTQFSLYSGSCGNYVPVKCNEDGPSATSTHFPAGFTISTVAGTTYNFMVDGFSFNSAVSTGEFCLLVTQLATITCTDPTITSGTTSQSDTLLCFDDTLTVTSTGAVSPNTGDYFGLCWVITEVDISGTTDPLSITPLLSYGFQSPPPATSTRQYINDGTLTPGFHYWTPVIFGNAVAAVTTPNFLFDLTLDPACTFAGTSLVVNVAANGDPACSGIGVVELTGSQSYLSVFPSPVSNEMNIRYVSLASDKSTVVIKDELGRTLYQSDINGVSGINNHKVDVSVFYQGVYFITVTGNQEVRTTRFVKQ